MPPHPGHSGLAGLEHLIGLLAPGPASVAVVIPPAHQAPGHVLALLGHLPPGVDGDLGGADEVASRPAVRARERAGRDGASDHPLPGRPAQACRHLFATVKLALRLAVHRSLVGAGELLVEEEGRRQTQARHEAPGEVADDLDVVGRGAGRVDLLQLMAFGHGRDVPGDQVGDREAALLGVGLGRSFLLGRDLARGLGRVAPRVLLERRPLDGEVSAVESLERTF